MRQDETPLLTVFTPAYNRAHTLPRLYASLCRQSCQAFEWLVVDDGSQDHTPELLRVWSRERAAAGGFALRVLRQENQGMHGAHNTAYAHITTELNTCVDSDDWMPDGAVERIMRFWGTCAKDEEIAGFLGLDIFENGQVIGTPFPDKLIRARQYDFYHKYGVRGDKKFVIRTELTRRFPYPRYPGETYIGLNLKYLQLDRDYEWLCLNEPLCVVEYQADGSSSNMWRQYQNNPRGFLHYRFALMRLPYAGAAFRLRQAAHVPLETWFLLKKRWDALWGSKL